MLYRTLVVYPEDGSHMQVSWVKIWISSYYIVFTVSIDGGSDITNGVSVSTECLTAHLHRTHLYTHQSVHHYTRPSDEIYA